MYYTFINCISESVTSISVSFQVVQGVLEFAKVYWTFFQSNQVFYKPVCVTHSVKETDGDQMMFNREMCAARGKLIVDNFKCQKECVHHMNKERTILLKKRSTSPHSATFGSCPPPPPLGSVCRSPPSSLEISPRARDGARARLIVLSSLWSSDHPGPKPELVPGLEWWDTGPLCGRLPCCCWCCCWCSRTTISSQPTPPQRLPSTAWHVCLKLGLSRECSRDLKP